MEVFKVFYKFKSAKDYDSLAIDWHYTTVSDVKQAVLQKKCSGKRNKAYYDRLMLFNADTGEEYLDGDTLIEKNTSLVIHRAPRFSCLPIVVNPPVQLEESESEEEEDVRPKDSIYDGPSVSFCPTESEWIEFWNDLSPSTVLLPAKSARSKKAKKESKSKDLTDTPVLDSQQCVNSTDGYGASRDFRGGGMGGRSGRRGFGQGGLLDRIKPPPGYICHRCKVSGHFIQHCPTNGDPTYDIKRTMTSSDGSYALPGGSVAVLKPNEATSQKSIQGMPSTHSVSKIPAELYCPLCRAVMKDAVLASKCCFKSFCDECIRDYIISKSLCICGAVNVLPANLLPNKTLRDTIVRYLKSTNSNEANDGSSFQPQDMESSLSPQAQISCSSQPSKGVLLSPKSEGKTKAEEITEPVEPVESDNVAHETLGIVAVGKGVEVSKAAHACSSAPSGGVLLSPESEGNTKAEEITEPLEPVEAENVAQETLGEVTVGKGIEASEAVRRCTREPGSQMCPLVSDEEMQQKPNSEQVEKKKKLADMQPRLQQDCGYMPVESSVSIPYWNGNHMQPRFDGFGRPYCGQMPFMGYGLEPTSISLWAAYYHNPFGAQVHTMAMPPQSDLTKFGTVSGGGGSPSVMSTGEFSARKTTTRQKRDHDKSRGSMKAYRDREFNRDMIRNEDVTSVESDYKSSLECSTHNSEHTRTTYKRKAKQDEIYSEEHPHQPPKKERQYHHRSESELVSASRSPILPVDLPSLQFKSSTWETISDRKQKASVFARISFPEAESPVYKKRKLANSSPTEFGLTNHRSHNMTSNGYQCDTPAAVLKNKCNYADGDIYELRDDDRNLKRRAWRYESSPGPAMVKGRHSTTGRREKGVIAASVSRLSVY
ncbi:E3 ubiquitin ligase PQT3-like [Apium graveolens]|uniref:E3 ubiquitin ligase PQT3-like n=1 Tax=Apium graveolens TaxID=4045 RepID=UPI003D7AA767